MPTKSSSFTDEIARLSRMPDEAIDYSDAPALDDWQGAARGRFVSRPKAAPPRIALPEAVSRIYEAVEELEKQFPGRKFTPDGHLVGSLGEVVAAKALNLKLYPMSQANHDAFDDRGKVQIKMTAGNSIAMYGASDRLVVLRLVSSKEAEIVYDGPGQLPWEGARKPGKNGQRVISLAKLAALSREAAL